jgi:hypothetical protein
MCDFTQRIKAMAKYWLGNPPEFDDFGFPIDKAFVDGKTKHGPWAFMAPGTYKREGVGLGTGLGQLYEKQSDGKWMKTKG